MNRQFFGDTRDLFKLDLVYHLMKKMPTLDSFTFVPMLTGKDEKAGQMQSVKKDLGTAVKKGRAGSKNKDLLLHMERLQKIDDDTEYFRVIQSLFKRENILMIVFDQTQFSHKNRRHYFNTLIEQFPKKSLIFLDPDNGLEESNPSKKHLLFEEVKRVHNHMDDHSIMMIYQHFPRKPHDEYIKSRCSQLNEFTRQDPVTITDNEIVFFLITKNPELKTRLKIILKEYSNSYHPHLKTWAFA
jgi:hypothetical protein